MLKAVLVKGNPKYINTPIARGFYQEITDYVKSLGVDITTDPGEDFTCPPKADFYIAHSRGVGRERCFVGKPVHKYFLKFGDLSGIMHPKDRQWHAQGMHGNPPDEHFIFTDEMKAAIRDTVQKLSQAQSRQTKKQSILSRKNNSAE